MTLIKNQGEAQEELFHLFNICSQIIAIIE